MDRLVASDKSRPFRHLPGQAEAGPRPSHVLERGRSIFGRYSSLLLAAKMIQKFSLREIRRVSKELTANICVVKSHGTVKRSRRIDLFLAPFDGVFNLPSSNADLSLRAAKFRFPMPVDRADDRDVGRAWRAAAHTCDVPNQL